MPKKTPSRSEMAKATRRQRQRQADLQKINLGRGLAEYDQLLMQPNVFVLTPALRSAATATTDKLFYVGRRGTGKTATTRYVETTHPCSFVIVPDQLAPSTSLFENDSLRDTRQQPFKSIMIAFQRSLLNSVIAHWLSIKKLGRASLPDDIARELNNVEQFEFDARFLRFAEEALQALKDKNDSKWKRSIRPLKSLIAAVNELQGVLPDSTVVMIDRLDEAWDGTDRSVIYLMALMHACVELAAAMPQIKPLLFIRENIFERVRQVDNEFIRIETAVVSMEWTSEYLRELMERRLNAPFNTKWKLDGETWDRFFDPVDGHSSFDYVANFCQHRPRDVLTYCTFALEDATGHKQETVTLSSLQAARKRFSDSRLKDLGDEYAENYPNIAYVLERFYGLGHEFTFGAVTGLLQRLLVDEEIKTACSEWLFRYNSTQLFIEVLYGIGFIGIVKPDGTAQFRSTGAQSTKPPGISTTTSIRVHPTYVDALNLHDQTVATLPDDLRLKSGGLIDLPFGTTLPEYKRQLKIYADDLKTLPNGRSAAKEFESLVGNVIKLCFFQYLNDVQPKVRTAGNHQERDWICANVAETGFWGMVKTRYKATQVIWECKNYSKLKADDFHQMNYYLSKKIGNFGVIVCRDGMADAYIRHLKELNSQGDKMAIVLGDKDLQVFLRQAGNGKFKDGHISEIFNRTVRAL